MRNILNSIAVYRLLLLMVSCNNYIYGLFYSYFYLKLGQIGMNTRYLHNTILNNQVIVIAVSRLQENTHDYRRIFFKGIVSPA